MKVMGPQMSGRAGKATPRQEWEEKSQFLGCFQGLEVDTNHRYWKRYFCTPADLLFAPIQTKTYPRLPPAIFPPQI